MGHSRRTVAVIGVLCALVAALAAPTASAEPTPTLRSCSVPTGAADPQTATPAQVGIDAAKLRTAIAFASSRLRTNIQIYRNNCLVGQGPFNPVTDRVPWNLWSGTKSVVSMVAGVAYSEGRLRLDAPIGDYLPAGLGDAAHRAITVRDLLTQTSGLKQSIVSEGIPAALDLDIEW